MAVVQKKNVVNRKEGITEWLKVTYCKFVGRKTFVGSNPTLFKLK